MAIPIAILDCDLLLHGRGHKTLDRFDLGSVPDTVLLSQFGFPREFILYLVELLREALCRRTQRSRAISPEVQVLAALGFYTSGSFQTSMGDTIGISQASMSRCVSNVTRALVEKAPQFITFNRCDAMLDYFQRVAGFPGVLGVLDCVQVYYNYNFETLCTQATASLIRSSLSPPGHHQSSQHPFVRFLGDRRYPLRKWLMTPVDCPESPAEFQYNLAHAATHEIVDRTFRAIQTRFRCLDGTKGYLQYSPERSSSILLACCVLHNASLQSGLDAWTLERTDPLEQPESLEQRPEDRDSQAEDLRKQLMLKHFN
uniref:Putative nuclease HARBI1 n=1 Tax=Cyclopterus lumpus TaxID=8103 RepID=A0A8C2X1E0_CYCLU